MSAFFIFPNSALLFLEFTDDLFVVSKMWVYVAQTEPQTHIAMSCWYGEKEKNMKKAVKALKRAYPNIEIHPFQGLGHGSLVDATQLFVKELELFLNNKVLV